MYGVCLVVLVVVVTIRGSLLRVVNNVVDVGKRLKIRDRIVGRKVESITPVDDVPEELYCTIRIVLMVQERRSHPLPEGPLVRWREDGIEVGLAVVMAIG